LHARAAEWQHATVREDPISEQPMRRCSKCGLTFPDLFFRRAHSTRNSKWKTDRHEVCKGCEQTRRDTAKRERREVPKARNTLRSHYERYVKTSGEAITREQFASRFGWDPAKLAHDIEHAAKNGCPYCRKPFAGMGHGLADITLDIIDPGRLPYYATNTKWACSTCNKAKQRTAPEDWAQQLVCWDQWENRPAEDWKPTLFDLDALTGAPP
jgi:hypothetical protein